MSLLGLVNIVLLIAGLWIAVAGLVGASRFGFRPLIWLTISGLLVSASVLLGFVQSPYTGWISHLAPIAALVYNLKYRPIWQQRGITDRQLFLFAKR